VQTGGHLSSVLTVAGPSVGIGTTEPDQMLSVNGDASKVGGGSWETFSDARLKTVDSDYTRGLDEILKLQPVSYHYNDDNALGIPNGGSHIGFVAQEVEKVIPEAVTKNSQGYRMVNNDPIIMALLNAVKEEHKAMKQEQLKNQAMRSYLCAKDPQAEICARD
jgi:hypothetical protein